MTPEKVLEVINLYREKLEKMEIPKVRYPLDKKCNSNYACLVGVHYMLDELEILVQQGRMEKAFRWLGFVQGCLFVTRVYNIRELKEHNRPKEEAVSDEPSFEEVFVAFTRAVETSLKNRNPFRGQKK